MPDQRVPLVGADGLLTEPWYRYLHDLAQKSATQTDAATVSNPPTQAEVNAVVAIINALIDKLQAAGLME
jgi:phage tail sheath protein FI